jgi:hypothetical protein
MKLSFMKPSITLLSKSTFNIKILSIITLSMVSHSVMKDIQYNDTHLKDPLHSNILHNFTRHKVAILS